MMIPSKTIEHRNSLSKTIKAFNGVLKLIEISIECQFVLEFGKAIRLLYCDRSVELAGHGLPVEVQLSRSHEQY